MNRSVVAALAICQAALAASGVLEAGSSGCRLLVRLGSVRTVDSDGSYFVSIDGAGPACEAGAPVIPALRIFVPVPPGVTPTLGWTALRRDQIILPDLPVLRAPELVGTGLETEERPAPQRSWPPEQVSLSGVVPLAGCLFAVVDVHPWLPASGSTVLRELELDLSWPSQPGASRASGLAALLAPDGCPVWRTSEPGGGRESIFWGRPWARICIDGGGGYEVSCDALEAAGCEVRGVPSASLRLFTGPAAQFLNAPEDEHELTEIPFEVLDGGDGSFDSGDRLRFVGTGLNHWSPSEGQSYWITHRFCRDNVYWLTWGDQDGLRFQPADASPDGSTAWGPDCASDAWLEERNVWSPEFETTTGWVWVTLDPGEEQQVPFTLPAKAGGSCSITVNLISDTSISMTAEVWLGSALLGTYSWQGSGAHQMQIDGVSLPASGTLRIVSSASSEAPFSLDWIHIGYPMQLSASAGQELRPGVVATGRYTFTVGPADPGTQFFDCTDLFSPVVLEGAQLSGQTASFSRQVDVPTRLLAVTSSGWMSPDSISPAEPGRLLGTVQGADRLLIVPPGFLDAVWGLVAVYQARGLGCEVATTREIYDEFGQGVADPGAIRSAIRWAMDCWDPRVEGVVLVGDGHYDYLGRTTSVPEAVPPWVRLGPADPCCDDFFVMVHDGATLPELPISRIPVDSRAELLTYVSKLVTCESGANSGTWLQRVLLIADDEWGNDWPADETMHTLSCEELANSLIPTLYDRRKFYLIEYPWPSVESHPEKPEAREALVRTLCEGFGLVVYFGHGSAGQIAHEKVFLRGDVDRLTNGSRLPMFFWGTCDVGRFDTPGEDAIGERLVTHPVGGGISSIAATRGTYAEGNLGLAEALCELLYSNYPPTGGEALWLAKLSESSYASNNRYYIYFGDLDTRLYRPDGEFPVEVDTDTLRTGEVNTVSGTGLSGDGLALVDLRESSVWVDYTCLGGAIIHWLRHGGTAYRGSAAVNGGAFQLPCFVPIQSTPGGLGRSQAGAPSPGQVLAAAVDPLPVVQGEPSGDDHAGPDAALWIDGYKGVENPVVSGDLQVEADLSDSSGICFLGGQGRALTLFVDGQGTDVGQWFGYDQGSTTSGHLSYAAGQLGEGLHTLILWSFDGVGNSSQDTLLVESGAPGGIGIAEALVYPNPCGGPRCFSFRVSQEASVTISIYTVTGRRIRRLDADCGQGYNQVLWDGLDADGDIPASGAYIYRIEAVASGPSGFDLRAVATGVVAQLKED